MGRMPPANFDAMIQDVSNNMHRSQLLRRTSANSSHTLASSKRGSRRVGKVNSSGNSPHNIQRRRTTASHSTRITHPVAQDRGHPVLEQRIDGSRRAEGLAPSARPMSWHPDSRAFETTIEQFSRNDLTIRNAITELQNLDVSSMPIPSTKQQCQSSLPMDQTYPTNSTPYHRQSTSEMEGYDLFEPNGNIPYSTLPLNSLAGQNPGPNMLVTYGYDTHSFTNIQEPDWSQFSSGFHLFPQPESPDVLLIQHPIDLMQKTDIRVAPKIPKKQSKELVGMGLYDDMDRENPSSFDYSALPASYFFNSHRDSVGKGLKLEETWQPPKNLEEEEKEANEVAEDEEEEAYSSDEADDDLPPIVSPTRVAETQKSFYPTYGDLSNQTFFLDEDSYTSCLSFDQQAIQVCQKPNVSDAAYGGNHSYNCVWI